MDSTTMKGTAQGYFDRAFDQMPTRGLRPRSPTAAWGWKPNWPRAPEQTLNAQRSTLNS